MSTTLHPSEQSASERFRELKASADVMIADWKTFQESPDGQSDMRPLVESSGKFVSLFEAGRIPPQCLGLIGSAEAIAKHLISMLRSQSIDLANFVPSDPFFTAIGEVERVFYPADSDVGVYMEPVHQLVQEGVRPEQIAKMTGISLGDARKYSMMKPDDIPRDIVMPEFERLKAEKQALQQKATVKGNPFRLSLLVLQLASMGLSWDGVRPEAGDVENANAMLANGVESDIEDLDLKFASAY